MESTFGTKTATGISVLPVTCTPKEFTNAIDAKQNTATNEPMAVEMLNGTKGGTVNITGNLVTNATNMDILASLAMHITSNTKVFQSTSVPKSATIYRYDVGSGKTDWAIGCVCTSMKISGSQGGLVTIDASFNCVEIERDGTEPLLGTPTVPLLTPTKFQDCTISDLSGTLLKMTSFEFNVTNTYADDEYRYQNSETILAEGMCKGEADLSVGFIYDTDNADDVYGNLVGTVVGGTIGIGSWTLLTYGKFLEFDQPDGECVFKGSFKRQCLREGSNLAVSLTT